MKTVPRVATAEVSASALSPVWPPPPGRIFSLSDYHPPMDFDLQQLQFLSEDDPAFFMTYSTAEVVHAALAQPNPPVPQGANPAASLTALQNWVHDIMVRHGGAGVTVPPGNALHASRTVYQCFTNPQHTNVINDLIAGSHPAWIGGMFANGLSVGALYVATPTGGRNSPQAVRLALHGW